MHMCDTTSPLRIIFGTRYIIEIKYSTFITTICLTTTEQQSSTSLLTFLQLSCMYCWKKINTELW